VRWAQTPRVPKTSVLGHSLLVAATAYFFIRELNPAPKRVYNAFFGGLYHDLPEAVTRDIISPVKNSSEELDSLIKTLERKLADEEIFPLVEPFMVDELKYFAQEEFSNKIIRNGIVECGHTFAELDTNFNSNEFSPYDGEIIRASDHLSTFLEAWHSCDSGIKSEELRNSYRKIRETYEGKTFGPINLSMVYSGFADDTDK
jgi:putative hydrolase of HD superfamily